MAAEGSGAAMADEEAKAAAEETKEGATPRGSRAIPATVWDTVEQTDSRRNSIHLNPEEQVRLATEGAA